MNNKIAFVTGYNGNRPAGLERFLIELLKAMDKQPQAHLVIVYTKRGNGLKAAFEQEHIQNIKLQDIGFGKMWKDVGLFFAPKADVYVFNGPQVPLFFVPKKYSVIAYDFAYRQVAAESMSEKIKNKLTDVISSLAFRRSVLVMTLSQTIKKEAAEIFHISEKKIEPIYAGFSDVCQLHAAQSLNFAFKDFWLFVSTIKERKNVLGVVQGFHCFQQQQPSHGTHLVIAGKYNSQSSYFKKIQHFIEENNLKNSVHFLGHITDSQLSWLYQNALALVSPSFVEGFGLPLLEAFVCRLPVITSQNSCQSEITDDAALLVDPKEPQQIGEAMWKLMKNPQLRSFLIEKGLNRAKNFSWEKSAQVFFSLIGKVVHRPY